jgi:hypothetical protein
MNQHSNPWTPERDDRLTELWASGLSSRKIGDAMGMSKNAIVGRVHRMGLPSRPRPESFPLEAVTDEQRGIIRRMWGYAGQDAIMRAANMGWKRILKTAAVMDLPPRKATRAVVARAPAARINNSLVRAATIPLREDVSDRRVFDATQCSFVMVSTGRQHRYCDEPCVANEKGRPSPYCPDHYAICIIGAPGPKMPATFKWRD